MRGVHQNRSMCFCNFPMGAKYEKPMRIMEELGMGIRIMDWRACGGIVTTSSRTIYCVTIATHYRLKVGDQGVLLSITTLTITTPMI